MKATQGDFFIKASTSFWNTISFDDAVNFTLAHREQSSERVAQELCGHAYKKAPNGDISVIFINVK